MFQYEYEKGMNSEEKEIMKQWRRGLRSWQSVLDYAKDTTVVNTEAFLEYVLF